MKILVTGGSGFLGSHVADELTKKGHEVTIFDNKKSDYIRKDQKMFVGDITDIKSINKAIKGKKFVYHFAGMADIKETNKKPLDKRGFCFYFFDSAIETLRNSFKSFSKAKEDFLALVPAALLPLSNCA